MIFRPKKTKDVVFGLVEKNVAFLLLLLLLLLFDV